VVHQYVLRVILANDQVAGSVVALVAVHMMNYGVRRQRVTKRSLRDCAMLKNVLFNARVNLHVAFGRKPTATFPTMSLIAYVDFVVGAAGASATTILRVEVL